MSVDTVAVLFFVGVICVVAGAVGGGVKLFGSEVQKFAGVGRSFLVILVGVVMLFSSWQVKQQQVFKVLSASIDWDKAVVEDCSTDQHVTISITTGGVGGGDIDYRVLLNDEPLTTDLLHLVAENPKTYALTSAIPVAVSDAAIGGSISIAVEVLSPNEVASVKSPTIVRCREAARGSQALNSEIEDYFIDYNNAISNGGRTSKEVLDRYYEYPLHWYRHRPDFSSATDFEGYIESSKPKSKSKTKTQVSCVYSKAKIIATEDFGDEVSVVTRIDWEKSDHSISGSAVVRYILVRSEGDPEYRMRSADQDSYDDEC